MKLIPKEIVTLREKIVQGDEQEINNVLIICFSLMHDGELKMNNTSVNMCNGISSSRLLLSC